MGKKLDRRLIAGVESKAARAKIKVKRGINFIAE